MSSDNHTDLTSVICKANHGIRISLKVSPGASKTKIIGLYGDALKVAVNAPPEKGKANQTLIRFISKTLGVAKSQINIVSGQTSKTKVAEINGISLSDCISKIKKLL